jgi:cell division protein FtsB
MRFALLVLVLLGGGLICLLVINTTLGATTFRISQLQSTNATLVTQEQALQRQIAAEQSPALIARRAYQLGMRAEPNDIILDLRTHRFDKLAAQPGATVQLGAPSATGPVTKTGAAASSAKAGAGQKQTTKPRRTPRLSGSGL